MNKLGSCVKHLVFAFLCTKNRSMTMLEHSCNEWGLFDHPEWLLEHYFLNSGVVLDQEEKDSIFNFIESRNGRQILESFLCPVNRHCTRLEYNCSDEDFVKDRNHDLLIRHYASNGGAEAFAIKREKFLEKSKVIKTDCEK